MTNEEYLEKIAELFPHINKRTRLVQIAVAESNDGDLEAAVITESLSVSQAWNYLENSFAAPHRIAVVEVRIPVRQVPVIPGKAKEPE
jgi:hypothetical protein